MNKYILFYITMFTLLFMYSCKQDDFIQTDDYPHKIESKAISWQKFKELNSNTKQISDLIRKYVDVEDSIIGKTNEIDWRIDTTYVNQIISSNLVTYTFNVIENSEIEGFRNVIMRKTADEINVYLVHYPEGVDKKKKNARAIVQKLDGDLFLSKTKECYELEFKCQLCGLFSCNIKPGWVLVKVSCNDGGGSGGGDSGEWTPTNPIDEFDPDGGGPIGGGPGGAPQTPCEQLNKSSKDTRFKNKMDELKTARSGNKEK